MKNRYIITSIVLLMMPLLASAQYLKGSYFLDNSINRHEMNPAFAPRANYFQVAGICNLGLGVTTNLLNVDTYLYPRNGELLTFLHKDVSVKEFDKKLPKHMNLDADVNTTLLGFGFYTKQKSFWTFDLDVVASVDVDLPRDLFMFLKKGTGTSGESYNIGNVNAYAMAGVEATLGYSRIIIDGLRAGVKARFIAPLAYGGVNLENVRLNTGLDKWTVNTEGYAYTAMHGLRIRQEEPVEGETATIMPSFEFNLDELIANKVLAGFGYSFDIGAEYELQIGNVIDAIRFSAAVTDLGQIHYNKEALSAYKTSGYLEWAGFQNVTMDNYDFEAEIEKLTEDAEGLLNLEEMEYTKSFTRSTMPRFYAGVEVPFFRNKLSLGLLYSSRLSHSYPRHELTASLNIKPAKIISLGFNWSFLNTVSTIGYILEFTPKVGPTFYIGADYIPAQYMVTDLMNDAIGEDVLSILNRFGLKGVPLPMSTRFKMNFGFAFNIGSKYVNPKKDKKK